MVFHWSLSENKFPQVSRIFLSILAGLSNVIVWMASTRPVISKSSSPFTNPLVNVPRVPFTIGITVIFMFLSCCFFQYPWKVQVLILLFAFFQLYSVICRDSTFNNSASSFFLLLFLLLLIIIRSGRLAEIKGAVCISKLIIIVVVFFVAIIKRRKERRKNIPYIRLCHPGGPKSKNQRNQKDKFLDLAWEQRTLRNMRVTV